MRRKAGKTASDLVTATEIACFVYCPEQWRLEYGQGLEPANRAVLAAGTRHHARKTVAERMAGGLILLGQALAVIALLVLLLLLWDVTLPIRSTAWHSICGSEPWSGTWKR
jgi:hypothetical protein